MRLRGQRGQVLMILLGSMLFGTGALAVGTLMTGKPLKELRSDVKRVIEEKDRRRDVLAAIEDWEKLTEPLLKEHSEIWNEVFDLLDEHDANAGDFKKLFRETDRINQDAMEMAIEGRRQFRANLSKAEWTALFGS